jgi:hypothetical protein
MYWPLTSPKAGKNPTLHHSNMALAIKQQLSRLTGPDNGA